MTIKEPELRIDMVDVNGNKLYAQSGVLPCQVHTSFCWKVQWKCRSVTRCGITLTKVKMLKVWTFVYCRLQGNQYSSGLQCEVANWPALAVGSAVQLAAPIARTNGLWTCSLQLDRPTYAPASHTMWPSPRNCYLETTHRCWLA